MNAQPGDRLVIASRAVGGVVRDGEILEARGAGGGPPYLVRWSDNGHEALYFPGVDAHLLSATPEVAAPTAPQPAQHQGRHIRSWSVTVDLFEDGLETAAHAVLRSEAPEHLDAHGTAHRRPSDPDVPEIGDEIAVARALRRLADRLLESAETDIQAIEGKPVALRES
jgi:Domain of unknown function (DUF1876)/Domain of unknown function (DUF1918)